MGFYPKHLKQRLHRARMRVIAMAALAGATFKYNPFRERTGRFNYNGDEMYRMVHAWCVVYPDGSISTACRRKSEAAVKFLHWFGIYRLGSQKKGWWHHGLGR